MMWAEALIFTNKSKNVRNEPICHGLAASSEATARMADNVLVLDR